MVAYYSTMIKFHFCDIKLLINAEDIQSAERGYQEFRDLRTVGLDTSMTFEWGLKDKTGQENEVMGHLITVTYRKRKDRGVPG